MLALVGKTPSKVPMTPASVYAAQQTLRVSTMSAEDEDVGGYSRVYLTTGFHGHEAKGCSQS